MRLLQGAAGDLEVVVSGYLEEVPVDAFVLDTGAQVCLISENFYEQHQHSLPELGPVPDAPVEVADGSHAVILGSFNLRLSVLNHETQMLHEVTHPFLVVQELSTPVLLGLDACRRLFSKLDFQSGHPEFESVPQATAHQVKLITTPAAAFSTPLRVVKSASLAPGFTRMVACSYAAHPFNGEDAVIVRPIPFCDSCGNEIPSIFVPHLRDSTLPSTRRYWVQLMNTSPFHLSFPAGLTVGRVYHMPGEDMEVVKAAPDGEYRINRAGELQHMERPQVASTPKPRSTAPSSALPATASCDPSSMPQAAACSL